jgi:hypothetical protein
MTRRQRNDGQAAKLNWFLVRMAQDRGSRQRLTRRVSWTLPRSIEWAGVGIPSEGVEGERKEEQRG